MGLAKQQWVSDYEGEYFNHRIDKAFLINSSATIRRLLAVIQEMYTTFSDNLRKRGHKYHIDRLQALTGVGDVLKITSSKFADDDVFEVEAAGVDSVSVQPADLDRTPQTGIPTKLILLKND